MHIYAGAGSTRLACLCMELLVLLVLAVSCASSRSNDGPKEQAGWAEHPPRDLLGGAASSVAHVVIDTYEMIVVPDRLLPSHTEAPCSKLRLSRKLYGVVVHGRDDILDTPRARDRHSFFFSSQCLASPLTAAVARLHPPRHTHTRRT